MGLDWAKIREEYEKKATPEELHEADWADRKLKKPRQSRAKAPHERNYHRGPRRKSYDVEAIILDYKEGMTCYEIALEHGCSASTVRSYLENAGVYDPNRDKGGSLPREVCRQGHKYSEVGYYVTKKGGKDCKQCKRERERAKRELLRKAMERA